MFWIIQNNFYNNDDQAKLVSILSRYGLEYQEVDIQNISSIKGHKNTIVCGGTALSLLAKQRKWKPGSFLNNNFTYDKWIKAYGDNMLNCHVIRGKLSDAKPTWKETFIRPCEDSKVFGGWALEQSAFDLWKDMMINKYKLGDTKVITSEAKQIFEEYRFFVIDKNIVAYSQYKMGSIAVAMETVSKDSYKFAARMIQQWTPARAFVIDVANTIEGLKIVEFNNINSAGFYGCNIGKIVGALETME